MIGILCMTCPAMVVKSGTAWRHGMDPAVLLNMMVELAGLEEELAAARAVLAHHGKRDRHLRELRDEYAADAAAAETAGQDAAVNLRRTEGRIRDVEAALVHKRDQIIGVSDRRQYKAMQTEIRTLEAELEKLETAGLEILESSEQSDESAEEARVDLDRQAIRGAEEIARMEAETVKARAAEEEITEEIERLVAIMPQAEARHVARLREQYGRAAVRVQGGACGGCFGQLPVQVGIDAEQGRSLVRCASCARYVVRKSYK
jgi:predicted  nucleic acid-binding Zn-ribbon protein